MLKDFQKTFSFFYILTEKKVLGIGQSIFLWRTLTVSLITRKIKTTTSDITLLIAASISKAVLQSQHLLLEICNICNICNINNSDIHLCIELLVLSEKVDTELGKPDEIL